MSLDENLEMIADTVSYLTSEARNVFYDAEHFFDGWKLDADYSTQTLKAAILTSDMLVELCNYLLDVKNLDYVLLDQKYRLTTLNRVLDGIVNLLGQIIMSLSYKFFRVKSRLEFDL